MTEGIVRIYMSYLEPEDRGLIWMRPYLDREGYELLFFGAKGWTRWLPCCREERPPLGIPGGDYEHEEHPGDSENPCGCLE